MTQTATPQVPAVPPGLAEATVSAGSAQRRERWTGLALVLPALLIVGGVYLYPMITTLVYAVSSIDIATYTIESFVGVDNFARVIGSAAFLPTLLRTLYFGLLVVMVTLVPSLFIALVLNERFWGRTFVRLVVLLPWAVPPVVGGVLWGQMFQPEFGFINKIMGAVGLPSDTIWLGDPSLALHALVIAESWRWIPFATLFLLAGLQTIPTSTLEASQVDGASAWQRLRHITLPQLMPTVLPVMIFLFVWAMKTFDVIFVLTRGGPGGATTTLNYMVYEEGFDTFRFGNAAAIAWLLTLVTVLVIGLLGLVRKMMSASRGES